MGPVLLLLPAGFIVAPPPILPAAASALASYSAALIASPLETKIATACVLAIAGDALAQRRECRDTYDARRASSFVLFDAIYRGGFQHFTFPIIADSFHGAALHGLLSWVPLSACAAVERTAANQLVIVPVVYYPLFFAVTAIVQGLTRVQGLERARSKFLPLILRNLLFWVPVQLAQFAFVAESWQVSFVCVMGLIWNVILSALAGDASVPAYALDDDAPSDLPGRHRCQTVSIGAGNQAIRE